MNTYKFYFFLILLLVPIPLAVHSKNLKNGQHVISVFGTYSQDSLFSVADVSTNSNDENFNKKRAWDGIDDEDSLAKKSKNAWEGTKKKKSSKKKEKKNKLKWKGNFKFAFRYCMISEEEKNHLAGFELSALNFKFEYPIRSGIDLKIHYQVDPNDSELEYAFVELKEEEAFFDYVSMGLQPRLFKLKSDLETDSLNKISFYKMEDLGVRVKTSFLKNYFWVLELANGGRLDTRDISLRKATKQDVILADEMDKKQSVGSNSRELITGFGYSINDSKAIDRKRIKVLIFSSVKSISDEDDADLNTLADIPDYTGVQTGNTSYFKTGINSEIKYLRWTSYSQLIFTIARKLERNLFTTELGYNFAKWNPIIAYSQQKHSVSPQPQSPLTWERRRYTFGLRYKWLKSAKLYLEWIMNDEDTGGDSINNDEILMGWRYNFKK